MLQKIIGVGLILLGLIAAAVGTATATVWRQSDTVVASTSAGESETMLVTDPGVLDMVGQDVTIKASAPGDQQVVLAIGRDVDVDGWVGDDPYVRVTGMTTLETLSAEAVEAPVEEPTEGASDEPVEEETEEAEPEPVVGPDPSGSDMWVAVAEGEGQATLRWTEPEGRWSLIAAGVGEGAQAPTLELTWPRETSTPWLWPGVITGGVLVLLGVIVLVVSRTRRRPAKSRRGTSRRAVSGAESPAADADGADGAGSEDSDNYSTGTTWSTASFPDLAATGDDSGHGGHPSSDAQGPGGVVDAAPVVMTRRELRERAAREQALRDGLDEPAAESKRSRRRARKEAKNAEAAAVAPEPARTDGPAGGAAMPWDAADDTDGTTEMPAVSDHVAGAPPAPPSPTPAEEEPWPAQDDAGGAPGWPGSAIAEQESQPAPRHSTADAWRRTWGFSTSDDETDGGDR